MIPGGPSEDVVPESGAATTGGQARAEARRFGRSAGLLSIGVGSAGLLTYLYFSLASHSLSKHAYGEIVVLWTAVFVTISVIFRPVEQLLSRTIAEHEAHGRPYGHPLRIAASIQAGLAAVFTVVALALRGPIQDDLLGGSETLYWILVGAVVAFGASFFARGYLAGRRRFALYAGVLLTESTARCAFALAVALGIASGRNAVALGVIAAPVLSLMVVPVALSAIRLRGTSPPTPAPVANAEPAGAVEFSFAHGGGFAAAVLLIMLSEQTFLNAGPLLVDASAGKAAAGFIFNVLMIARAPLVLFQAVATSLLPHLTRLRSRGGEGEDAFRLSVRSTIRAIAAFAGLVGLVVLIAGPALMEIAFGDKFTYDRVALLLVTAGMGLYLSAATLNQAALAQGQARRAAICWVSSAAVFLIFNLLPILTVERRVEVGFALCAALLAGLLYALYRRPRARPADAVRPGSAEELEARLAAAEEAG